VFPLHYFVFLMAMDDCTPTHSFITRTWPIMLQKGSIFESYLASSSFQPFFAKKIFAKSKVLTTPLIGHNF
jgi:hypothetical protein